MRGARWGVYARPRPGKRFASTLAPVPLSGLAAWYDFSAGGDVFEDTSGADPAEADDAIARVADRSGNGRALTQATSGNRPVWKAAIQNGLSVGRFDATDDFMTVLAAPVSGDATIFAVGAKTTADADGIVFLGQRRTSADNPIRAQLQITGATGIPSADFRNDAGSLTQSQAAAVGTAFKVLGATYSGTTQTLYAEGGPAADDQDTNSGGTTTTDELVMGTRDGTFAAGGDVGEVLLYDRALSVAELNAVGRYLATKWGLTWTEVFPVTSGNVGRYDFSDASTVFEDTARTDAAEADDPVAGVTDKSGAGNHLSQATAGNRPLRKTAVQNGLDVSRYDGSNDYLESTGLSEAQPLTLFAVVQKGTGSSHRTVVDGRDGSNNTTFWRANSPSTWHMYAGGTAISDGALTDNAFHIYAVTFDGASSSMYEDGVLRLSGNPGTTGWLTGVRFGADRTGAAALDGDIGELVLYDRALSIAELNEVGEYLEDKWGIGWTSIPTVVTGAVFSRAPTFPTGAVTSVRNLAGILFAKAPTFPTGAVTSIRNLAGILFAKAPTFPQGSVGRVFPGTLFARAPTFPTGAVTSLRNLAGVLFTKAPTFATGAITSVRDLAGVLFARAPTFPTGTVSTVGAPQDLAGVLFSRAPTFATGSVTSLRNLAGVLFARAPTFPTGAITSVRNLAGVLFSRAPTFATGAITSTRNVSGVLFSKAPTFPQGRLVRILSGVLFSRAPTFPTGVVGRGTVNLAGVLFSRAPTFGTGTVTSVRNLAGTTFARAPTFPTGAITSVRNLAGVLFSRAPTFPQGRLVRILSGTTFSKAPTFATGTVGRGAVNLAGTTFVRAATFLAGTVSAGAGQLLGVLFSKAPTFPAGTVGRGAVALSGVLFVRSPTFPTGTVTPGVRNVSGVLFARAPTFPTGTISSGNSLVGTTFVRSPTFAVGTISTSYALAGVLLSRSPTFPTGAVVAVYEIDGTLFASAPFFPPGGSVLFVGELVGVTFLSAPFFPTGEVAIVDFTREWPVSSAGEWPVTTGSGWPVSRSLEWEMPPG